MFSHCKENKRRAGFSQGTERWCSSAAEMIRWCFFGEKDVKPFNEKPTQPGHYWMETYRGWLMTKVSWYTVFATNYLPKKTVLVVQVIGSDDEEYLSEVNTALRWAGPIPEPT